MSLFKAGTVNFSKYQGFYAVSMAMPIHNHKMADDRLQNDSQFDI